MILIQKVNNYDEINAIVDNEAKIGSLGAIYKFNKDRDVFEKYNNINELKPSLLNKFFIGKNTLPCHYYICQKAFPFEWEVYIRNYQDYQDCSVSINVKLKFIVNLDMEKYSDAGKGLWEWLEGREIIDNEVMEAYVKKEMANRDIVYLLDLKEKAFDNLNNNSTIYNKEWFREKKIFEDWLAVECFVLKADECKELHEIQGLKLPKAIEGKPFCVKSLIVDINNVRLELESKQDVIVGSKLSDNAADVSVLIPEGCMEEKERDELNECISRAHARLVYHGQSVLIKSLYREPSKNNNTTITSTYLNEEKISSEGKTFAENVELGFSYDVRWKCNMQKGIIDDSWKEIVLALVLNYPACNNLYKIFVWPSCRLKAVDSRLPNWRITYQSGAHGSEGAFYVTTSAGRSIYLNPQQLVVENVEVKIVND